MGVAIEARQKLKPYPTYVDSRLDWLGKVPEHWTTQRIKTLFRETDESRGGNHVLLSLTRNGGIVRQSEASSRMASAEDLSKYKVCRPGDLVMNRMQAWSGMFALSSISGLVSPDYSVFRPIRSLEPKYFEHLFKTPMLVSQFAQRSKGIGSGFNRLYTPEFGSVPVPVPPVQEQVAIVHFLDHADRRIRRFIGAKQKLIALLNEEKQAIIYRAVTRGLDPNVRLKPSGVEWLGDVPEHWKVERLKTRLMRNDSGSWGSTFSDSGVLVLRSTEQTVDGGWRIENPARRLLTQAERKATVLQAGDLVVTKSSGSAIHIGKTSLVTEEMERLEFGFSNFVQRLRTDSETSPSFLWLLMNNTVGRLQLVYNSSTTTGLGNLNRSVLGNLWFAFPPRVEQGKILSVVQSRTAGLDAAIARTRRQIEVTAEYLTCLISNVVSGKLDVRDVAARLPGDDSDVDLFEDVEGVQDGEGDSDADTGADEAEP